MGDIREINRIHRIETRPTLENYVDRKPKDEPPPRRPHHDASEQDSPHDEVEIHLEELESHDSAKPAVQPKPVTFDDGHLDISA